MPNFTFKTDKKTDIYRPILVNLIKSRECNKLELYIKSLLTEGTTTDRISCFRIKDVVEYLGIASDASLENADVLKYILNIATEHGAVGFVLHNELRKVLIDSNDIFVLNDYQRVNFQKTKEVFAKLPSIPADATDVDIIKSIVETAINYKNAQINNLKEDLSKLRKSLRCR